MRNSELARRQRLPKTLSRDVYWEEPSVAQGLSYKIKDGIAILSVNQDPGHLSGQVIDSIGAALCRAQAEGVLAVVIAGKGDGFPDGPPLSEILSDVTVESLGKLCSRVACSELPVVAAMQGTVCGGALSLALSTHARVAHVGTRIGFKEIEWGVCPFAGATQRLSRILGAGPAIELMLSGRLVPAEHVDVAPLFERLVGDNLMDAAIGLARDLAVQSRANNRRSEAEAAGLSDPIQYQRAVAGARKGVLSAEAKAVVDCVEAAQLLTMEAGQAFETSSFHALRESSRAAALVHVAQAEAIFLTARHPAPKDVVVFGDSRMARGVAIACLDAGARVHLAERAEGGAGRLVKEIEKVNTQEVAAGHTSAERAQARQSRLSGGRLEDVIGSGEIVIEAGGFPLSAMGDVADLLTSATGPDIPVLLGSNVALRGGAMAHLFGGRVLGAAFQPPPQLARLVELVVPDAVSAEAVIRSEALARAMRKVVLHVAPRNGCLLQTLVSRFFAAAEWCVLQGASPSEVDRALGWRAGPFAMMDREGLGAQPARLAAINGHERENSLNSALLAVGRDGIANGRGYYRYDDNGQNPRADPEADALVARWRDVDAGRQGPVAEEIRQRILLALVSVGLELMEGGVIGRAAEVDLAAIHGLGMPRSSGGPMKWAENAGLIRVRKALERFSASDPRLWQVSPILDDRIKDGTRFGD